MTLVWAITLDTTLRVQARKAKVDNWDSINIELLGSKRNDQWSERQPVAWEEYLQTAELRGIKI
jgi:hypothetical protein